MERHVTARIQVIPRKDVECMRAGVIVPTYSHCAIELVKNGAFFDRCHLIIPFLINSTPVHLFPSIAIDAGAQTIRLHVNKPQSMMRLIDDGHGIHPEDLEHLGSFHGTSYLAQCFALCRTYRVLNMTRIALVSAWHDKDTRYGRHGDALAAMCQVSDVHLLTLAKGPCGPPREVHIKVVICQVPLVLVVLFICGINVRKGNRRTGEGQSNGLVSTAQQSSYGIF